MSRVCSPSPKTTTGSPGLHAAHDDRDQPRVGRVVLARPVGVERPHGHRLQAEREVVGVGHQVGGRLGRGVRRVRLSGCSSSIGACAPSRRPPTRRTARAARSRRSRPSSQTAVVMATLRWTLSRGCSSECGSGMTARLKQTSNVPSRAPGGAAARASHAVALDERHRRRPSSDRAEVLAPAEPEVVEHDDALGAGSTRPSTRWRADEAGPRRVTAARSVSAATALR